MKPFVTIIGRGHSGTRAISHTLSASGVFMGCPQNESGDLLPPGAMYEACRLLATRVRWNGGLEWDFHDVLASEPTPEFQALIRSFLQIVLASPAPYTGWKIPETTLVYPWIQRMFPQTRYIFWIRDPRDCVIGRHLTDDLAAFGVPHLTTADERLRRAISWKYQYDLVKATPQPAAWIEIRFEDFVLRQEETLQRLEAFLGIPLARIPVRADAVGRWRKDAHPHDFDFFEPAMRAYGYARPAAPPAAEG